jgi:hypothetical protein
MEFTGPAGGVTTDRARNRQAVRHECPVTAGDIVATIYHGLGIAPDLELRDRLDRPIPLLPEGAPIRDLFS